MSIGVSKIKDKNAITSSASASISPAELAQLLKSYKVTITAHPPINRVDDISRCKGKFYSSARWGCVRARSRSKTSNLKWHHTNFNGKLSKPAKVIGKPGLPYATPLAQAWLDLAVRDLAAAETLEEIADGSALNRFSRLDDPCLISVTECDDIKPKELAENDITMNEINNISGSVLTTASDENCCLNSANYFLANNCKQKNQNNRDKWSGSHEGRTTKDGKSPKDIRDDVSEADTYIDQMAQLLFSEAHNFTTDHHQILQEKTRNAMNTFTMENSVNESGADDPLNSITLFEDLFENTSSLLNETWMSSDIMDKDFSLSETDFFNNCTTNTMPKIENQQSDIFAMTSQLQTNSCNAEDHVSDTDSGIHSPGALKSSIDEGFSWKMDVDNHDFDIFFNCTRTPCIKAEPIEDIIAPSNKSKSLLLNMDNQEQIYKVDAAFDAEELLVKPPKSGTTPTLAENNMELKPLKQTTWEISLTLDDQPRKLEPFVTSKSHPKDEESNERKHKNKSLQRSCAKVRRISDKGKSVHLWEFIRDILLEPKHCPSLIKWEDRDQGVFRFMQSDTVAMMWGEKKGNPKMTYEKLSRAMRYYYDRGILERVDGRRLVYKFGPNSHGWQNAEREFERKRAEPIPPLIVEAPQLQPYCPVKYDIEFTLTAPIQDTSSLPSANVLLDRAIKLST